MICGEAFETQCAIARDAWTCGDEECGGTAATIRTTRVEEQIEIDLATTAARVTTAPTKENHIVVAKTTAMATTMKGEVNVTVEVVAPPVFVKEESEEEPEFDVTKPSGELMVLGGVGL